MCDACAATIQRRVWVYNQSIAKPPMNAAKERNRKEKECVILRYLHLSHHDHRHHQPRRQKLARFSLMGDVALSNFPCKLANMPDVRRLLALDVDVDAI
jgi:hypothetical protein